MAIKTTKTVKSTARKSRASAKRVRKPQAAGPVVSKLPTDFDKWALANASRRVGLQRPLVVKESGQRCKWRPYLSELAQRNGMACAMRGRPAVFFFTKVKRAKPTSKAAS